MTLLDPEHAPFHTGADRITHSDDPNEYFSPKDIASIRRLIAGQIAELEIEMLFTADIQGNGLYMYRKKLERVLQKIDPRLRINVQEIPEDENVFPSPLYKVRRPVIFPILLTITLESVR